MNNPYSRMIRMPNGEYEEHFMVVARHSKDNPREVTIMLNTDVCELSKDEADNHFTFMWISKHGMREVTREVL